jgi:hypothetical protein
VKLKKAMGLKPSLAFMQKTDAKTFNNTFRATIYNQNPIRKLH